jgi:hypothetical protein
MAWWTPDYCVSWLWNSAAACLYKRAWRSFELITSE